MHLFAFLLLLLSDTSFAAKKTCPKDALFSVEEVKGQLEIDYLKDKSALLKKISKAQKALGREITWSEFKRSQSVSFLEQALQFDDPYLAYINIRPVFYEMYAGYFGFQHYATEIAAAKKNIPRKESFIFDQYTHAEMVARNWDIYTGIYAFLEKTAKSGAGRIQTNAKIVLDKLSAQYLMGDALKRLGTNEVKTPTTAELWKVIEHSHVAELAALKNKLNQERLALLIAVLSPGKLALKYGMQFVSKFEAVRPLAKKAAQYLLESDYRFLYYPTIQRIVLSEASAAQKAEMLLLENTGTDDELLITFARRIDLRNIWKEIQAASDAGDKVLSVKMDAVKKMADKMAPISLQGRSIGVNIISRVVEAGVVYGIYNLGDWLKWWGAYRGTDLQRRVASTGSKERAEVIAWNNYAKTVKPLTEKEQQEFDALFDGIMAEQGIAF